MSVKYGVNFPLNGDEIQDFVSESGNLDFVVVPSIEDLEKQSDIVKEYQWGSVSDSVEIFTKDYDNREVEVSQEFFEELGIRLINSANIGGRGFFSPRFSQDTESFDPLFRTFFDKSNAHFDIVFPFMDDDLFFEVFESIHPSKFKIHAQPSQLVGVDEGRLDDVIENIQFLSFPFVRGSETENINSDEYVNVVNRVFEETFYDDIYSLIHLVPANNLKDQVASFEKSRQEIHNYLENTVEGGV